MNHTWYKSEQAKYDIDNEIFAYTIFQKYGDRREKDGENDLYDLVVHILTLVIIVGGWC